MAQGSREHSRIKCRLRGQWGLRPHGESATQVAVGVQAWTGGVRGWKACFFPACNLPVNLGASVSLKWKAVVLGKMAFCSRPLPPTSFPKITTSVPSVRAESRCPWEERTPVSGTGPASLLGETPQGHTGWSGRNLRLPALGPQAPRCHRPSAKGPAPHPVQTRMPFCLLEVSVRGCRESRPRPAGRGHLPRLWSEADTPGGASAPTPHPTCPGGPRAQSSPSPVARRPKPSSLHRGPRLRKSPLHPGPRAPSAAPVQHGALLGWTRWGEAIGNGKDFVNKS